LNIGPFRSTRASTAANALPAQRSSYRCVSAKRPGSPGKAEFAGALGLRPWLVLFLLAIALAGGGCQTSMHKSLFTASGPGWTVQEGQALWRPGRRFPELAGEIVMARHEDGRCGIQFSKTPLPLVLAQTTGTNWLIQFPPQQMSFGGRGAPPRRFTWLYLDDALAGEALPKNLSLQRKPDGGWRLQNARTGETLEGFLTP
jgi:hypothetical protein